MSWSASTFDTPNPFRLAVNVSAPVTAVPEPSSLLLTALGLVALMATRAARRPE